MFNSYFMAILQTLGDLPPSPWIAGLSYGGTAANAFFDEAE